MTPVTRPSSLNARQRSLPGSAGKVQLTQGIVDMTFDRVLSDHEALGNLGSAQTLGDQVQYFALALAQHLRKRGRRLGSPFQFLYLLQLLLRYSLLIPLWQRGLYTYGSGCE